MDGTNGSKGTTRVTAPGASNALGVNVFTAPGYGNSKNSKLLGKRTP